MCESFQKVAEIFFPRANKADEKKKKRQWCKALKLRQTKSLMALKAPKKAQKASSDVLVSRHKEEKVKKLFHLRNLSYSLTPFNFQKIFIERNIGDHESRTPTASTVVESKPMTGAELLAMFTQQKKINQEPKAMAVNFDPRSLFTNSPKLVPQNSDADSSEDENASCL